MPEIAAGGEPGSASMAVALALLPPEVLPFLVLVALELLYLLTIAFAVVLRHEAAASPPSRADVLGLACLPLLPRVSCIVTCYSEGGLVARTLQSLLDQDYDGRIEVIPVIDGAVQNRDTLAAALAVGAPRSGRRRLRVVPKWIRGGRASSLNAGLAVAHGEIVMALDGDTSFDRDMVTRVVRHFRRPGVVAVAGTLRVRNRTAGVLTRLQSLDYLLFRHFVRAGLGTLNTVNNIPGAHGAFRRDVLLAAGGWDNGTAEDVDVALRLKKHFGRRPGWRIASAPDVISHTDVPARWSEFLRQRLRWEGDPVYLFLRKHGAGLRPGVLGWRNFVFAAWYALLFQILMPPAFLVALGLLLLSPHGAAAGAAFALGYGAYLVATTLLFLLHLALTSERPREDLRLVPWLPLYPLFVFLVRAWSGVAVMHSLLLRSHRDTSMAPWWVLRKSRF